MSRIATVQKALENILLHVNKNNIDISVVFFNHSHQVISTIPFVSERTLTGSLSIDELIKRINEIICFGSTEFSQIKLALEKLKKKCSKHQWDNMLSFITSDGHQTAIVDTNTIEEDMSAFFDYSVGIGNQETDFDKPFLLKISKNFVFGKSAEIINKAIHSILDNVRECNKRVDDLILYIPPNIKASSLCENEIVNVDESCNINLCSDKIEEILDSLWTNDNNDYTYGFKLNIGEDEILQMKYIHLIFVIDISSSMDENLDLYSPFSSSIIDYGETKHDENAITSVHDFMWKKMTFKTSLDKFMYCTFTPFPEYILVKYNTKTYKVKCQDYKQENDDLKNLFIFFNKISSIMEQFYLKPSREDKINILDTLIASISNDDAIENKIQYISLHFPMYSHIMKNFTNKINLFFFGFLTKNELTFFNLLHEIKDLSYDNSMIIQENVSGKVDPHLCIICYKNSRNILLSCGHISMCQSCTIHMINYTSLSCPICRANVTFLKKISTYSENLKCITLDCNNQISVLYDGCYHIYYCIDCFVKAQENMCLCGNKPNGIYSVQFS